MGTNTVNSQSSGLVLIPAEDYIDLITAKVKLDTMCDVMENCGYADKSTLLVIARGLPTVTTKKGDDDNAEPSGDNGTLNTRP